MNLVYAGGDTNSPRPVRQALGLFLVGSLIAAVVNTAHPRGVDLLRPWIPPDARAAQAAGVTLMDAKFLARPPSHTGWIVLDARDAREFAAGHVPGAISLPWNEFDRVYPRVEPLLDDVNQAVLVYCAHTQCDDGLMLARELRRRGAQKVSLLQGGFESWRKAGGAIEREPGP